MDEHHEFNVHELYDHDHGLIDYNHELVELDNEFEFHELNNFNEFEHKLHELNNFNEFEHKLHELNNFNELQHVDLNVDFELNNHNVIMTLCILK